MATGKSSCCRVGAVPLQSIVSSLSTKEASHRFVDPRLCQPPSYSPFSAGFCKRAAACADRRDIAGLGYAVRGIVAEHRFPDVDRVGLYPEVFVGAFGGSLCAANIGAPP